MEGWECSRSKNNRLSLAMKMPRLKNIHPGEVLQEEFLVPLDITAYRLSKDIDIPQTRISEIVRGNRRITADTALRLSKYFGNSAKFWLGLQDDFDIEEELNANRSSLDSIKTFNANDANSANAA
jgi:antitoxin HigA-1